MFEFNLNYYFKYVSSSKEYKSSSFWLYDKIDESIYEDNYYLDDDEIGA